VTPLASVKFPLWFHIDTVMIVPLLSAQLQVPQISFIFARGCSPLILNKDRVERFADRKYLLHIFPALLTIRDDSQTFYLLEQLRYAGFAD